MHSFAYTRALWRRTLPIVSGAVALLTIGAVAVAQVASAATVFTANFGGGSISGWSKSGGGWAVVIDGSRGGAPVEDRQRQRLFTGASSWTDYRVQARVKPLSLGSNGLVALLARAKGSTTFYRLALRPDNQVPPACRQQR